MTENIHDVQDPGLLSLQAELDRMAEEVPEMPESFQAGWRAAIREESRASRTSIVSEESRINRAAAASHVVSIDDYKPSARIDQAASKGDTAAAANSVAFRRRFSRRRMASIAAIFLFVLGGTLLGRDFLFLNRPFSPETASTSVSLAPIEEKESAGGALRVTSVPDLGPDAVVLSSFANSLSAKMESAANEELDMDEEAMALARDEETEEDVSEESYTESANQEPSVYRIAGWILIGLSAALAAVILVFRKRSSSE